MKYPLHTQSKSVSGLAAKKLLEVSTLVGGLSMIGCLPLQNVLLPIVEKHRSMASSGKFDGVDFSQINIESLTPELQNLGQGFRCVRGEFVTYWKQGRIQREM